VVILLLLLALFAFAYGGSSRFSSGRVRATPAERVPDAVGLGSPYASAGIRRAGLAPVVRWCAAGSFPEYMVARQSPAAGAIVPKGSRVRLFLVPALSNGVRHPSCPSFVGTRP
jgi:beta-lactam-binding protein with PASTA domain